MVHLTPDGGLAISILGPLTAAYNGMTLSVVTEYPFGDALDITVTGALAGTPLLVRVPGWATAANYSINGAAAQPLGPNGTMARLLLAGAAGGDAIHVELNPAIFVDSVGVLYNGAVSVHRGALVYGLSLGETTNVTATHTCPAPNHPQVLDYEINSTTPWNVALIMDPSKTDLTPFLTFARTGVLNATQPFDHSAPPLQITAMARVIPSWGLELGSAAGPPGSPACAAPGACGSPFKVTLVPFGMQHLRMSVLPWTLS